MTPFTEDFLVKAWKRQLDGALRMAEAITEGAEKIRQVQLDAAVEAHAARRRLESRDARHDGCRLPAVARGDAALLSGRGQLGAPGRGAAGGLNGGGGMIARVSDNARASAAEEMAEP